MLSCLPLAGPETDPNSLNSRSRTRMIAVFGVLNLTGSDLLDTIRGSTIGRNFPVPPLALYLKNEKLYLVYFGPQENIPFSIPSSDSWTFSTCAVSWNT